MCMCVCLPPCCSSQTERNLKIVASSWACRQLNLSSAEMCWQLGPSKAPSQLWRCGLFQSCRCSKTLSVTACTHTHTFIWTLQLSNEELVHTSNSEIISSLGFSATLGAAEVQLHYWWCLCCLNHKLHTLSTNLTIKNKVEWSFFSF